MLFSNPLGDKSSLRPCIPYGLVNAHASEGRFSQACGLSDSTEEKGLDKLIERVADSVMEKLRSLLAKFEADLERQKLKIDSVKDQVDNRLDRMDGRLDLSYKAVLVY